MPLINTSSSSTTSSSTTTEEKQKQALSDQHPSSNTSLSLSDVDISVLLTSQSEFLTTSYIPSHIPLHQPLIEIHRGHEPTQVSYPTPSPPLLLPSTSSSQSTSSHMASSPLLDDASSLLKYSQVFYEPSLHVALSTPSSQEENQTQELTPEYLNDAQEALEESELM